MLLNLNKKKPNASHGVNIYISHENDIPPTLEGSGVPSQLYPQIYNKPHSAVIRRDDGV